jgi:protein involved in polysaccharide export with SLBB domain
MRIKTVLLLMVGILLFGGTAYGQGSIQEELSNRNLSLSEAQNLARQAGINPNNPDELARVARANGVPENQIQEWLVELRMRDNGDTADAGVQDLRSSATSTGDIVERTVSDSAPQSSKNPGSGGLDYFGYNIFGDTPDPFKPDPVGPVGDGYVVGPEDELRLSVWGATEFQYELQVDVEGRVFIPNIGQIMVAGQKLSELRESLKTRLSQSYSGLMKDPPTIFMDLTVTRLRPIQVFVLGEVKNAGGYTFSHNSSIFNVLYGVGGPKTTGSLRDIRIIRDGKVISTVDLYDLLLSGVELNNTPLLNNDRIFIPQRKNTISIRGEVKRPAIYELNKSEDLTDLLE